MSPTYTKSKKVVQDNVVRNNTTGVVQRQCSQKFLQPSTPLHRLAWHRPLLPEASRCRANPQNIYRANQPHTTPPTNQSQITGSYSQTSTYQSQSTQNAQQNQDYSSSTWQYTQTTQPTQDQKPIVGKAPPGGAGAYNPNGARAGGKALVKPSGARRGAGK